MSEIPGRLPQFPSGRGGVFGGTQQGNLFVYEARFRSGLSGSPFDQVRSVIIQITDFNGISAEEEIVINER
jgi:hypothetical protein